MRGVYVVCMGVLYTNTGVRGGLVRVCVCVQVVTCLTNDVSVGEPHHETVLGGVVLVLVLSNKTLASTVVCLALCVNNRDGQVTHLHTPDI